MFDILTMTEDERIQAIASHVEAIIKLMGEDPEREGLKKTPVRCAKALDSSLPDMMPMRLL